MSERLSARTVLDRDFFQIRCRLLDIAAALDRLDRAPGRHEVDDDARLKQLYEGAAILAERKPDRARRIHLQFSQPYNPDWQRAS